jgi:hypothetical protein
MANLVAFERGLYALEIGERPCLLGQVSNLQVPAVHTEPATGRAARREDRLEASAYISQSGPITPLDMIFGHTASLARGNEFMAHRTGFTARSLHKLLIEAGFVEVTLR